MLPAVHLAQGKLPDYPHGAAGAALTALAREHGEVYVVDSEGVRRNEPDLEFLREATRTRPLWVDAGSRTAADAMDALVAGARRATIRWPLVRDAKDLEELADLAEPGSIYLALEIGVKGPLASRADPHAPPESVARLARDLGLGLAVMAPRYDAHLASRVSGVEVEKWWIGPLARDDAGDLKRLGFAGVVVPAGEIASVGTFEPPRPDVEAGAGEAERA